MSRLEVKNFVLEIWSGFLWKSLNIGFMVSDVLLIFLRQMDPNICFPWRRNHWRHWWKMKGIKTGKEEFTTNGLTTCLPKFPVIVFKELSLFKKKKKFPGVQLCWNRSEFASKKDPSFLTNTRTSPLGIWGYTVERRKLFSHWKCKYSITSVLVKCEQSSPLTG